VVSKTVAQPKAESKAEPKQESEAKKSEEKTQNIETEAEKSSTEAT
jgi:hypothetical protein